jgi:beta-phosphoglucomutase-like phosphatase (HAD superfamily)
LQRFKTQPNSPKNVLVFEDSVSGVKSALAAGMTVVMVPQKEFLPKNWSEIEAELEHQVAEIIYSMEYLLPEKYGLLALKELPN